MKTYNTSNKLRIKCRIHRYSKAKHFIVLHISNIFQSTIFISQIFHSNFLHKTLNSLSKRVFLRLNYFVTGFCNRKKRSVSLTLNQVIWTKSSALGTCWCRDGLNTTKSLTGEEEIFYIFIIFHAKVRCSIAREWSIIIEHKCV